MVYDQYSFNFVHAHSNCAHQYSHKAQVHRRTPRAQHAPRARARRAPHNRDTTRPMLTRDSTEITQRTARLIDRHVRTVDERWAETHDALMRRLPCHLR